MARDPGRQHARRFLGLALLGIALTVPLFGSPDTGIANSKGALAGFTGAPGEDTCRHCHDTFALNMPGGYIAIEGFPTEYVPSEVYSVTVTLVSENATQWGFQATTLTENRKRAGKFIRTDREHTKVKPGVFFPGRQYIMQKRRGSYEGQTGQAAWSFDWKAPKRNKGPVTLHVSANAANSNSEDTGDRIYYVQQTSQPAPGT